MRLAPLLAASLLLVPAPVAACEPEPASEWAPAGYSGCELDGRTDGIASTWNGGVAAANWCVYPWTECTTVSVQSHLTGLTIIVTPAQYCHCWVGVTGPNGETQRLLDLTPDQVRALGLDPRAGLFAITATPVREALGVLPDTAYNGAAEVAAQSHRLESRAARSGELPLIGRASARDTGGRP